MPVDSGMPAERHDCYAICPPGVEDLTAAELAALRITPGGREPGGVAFQATAAELYAANLHLRTATRVITRLAEFPAKAFYELERKAKRVPWAGVLAPGRPPRFRVTSRKSRLYHLDGVAERLSTVAGGPAERGGESRSDDLEDQGSAAQLFIVRIHRDIVTISADSSGELLHRRGYRQAGGKAPLRETLAAAMLLGAGYDGSTPLVDPFSGSGTIPIEAALLARRIAPGLQRAFAFEHWPSFDRSAWTTVRDEAVARIRAPAPASIQGSDRDAGAVMAARGNAERAGVAGDVTFRDAALSDLSPPDGPGFLASNPPYGVRLGEGGDLRDLYARLGAIARARCRGWTLALLSADPAHERQLGIPLTARWRSNNGGIPVRLVTGTIPA
jgi:putative N6-adenine-specific DNA methylase